MDDIFLQYAYTRHHIGGSGSVSGGDILGSDGELRTYI